MSITIIIEMDARQPKPLFLHPVKKNGKKAFESLSKNFRLIRFIELLEELVRLRVS